MNIKYSNSQGDFTLDKADESSGLYFPIGNEAGAMGCITPILHGDLKTGQNSFLLEPVSSWNLHANNNGRNMWFKIDETTMFALNGCSPWQMQQKLDKQIEKMDQVEVTAGKLWHKVVRFNNYLGFKTTTLSYAPVGYQVEIMKVTIENLGNGISTRASGKNEMTVETTVAIPIYGRSADNIRDHRHVTSLLHQIYTDENGILVKPTLSFDERGHGINQISYGVFAQDQDGNFPKEFFPIADEFIGEGYNLTAPKVIYDATYKNKVKVKAGTKISGFEAMGAMSFSQITLQPSESKTYYILLSYNQEGMELLEPDKEEAVFQATCEYWQNQVGIRTHTRNESYDQWLTWVGIQPTLRRIYGCSFLPHHDYGRGGRGFRDLWQDSLALLLNTKESIRDQLLNYYSGIRIDGSNATIIGKKPGEFFADRNSIVRMWMDHGVWPFITTFLYINQTGDTDILFYPQTYFKDSLVQRGEEKDGLWDGKANELRQYSNEIYKGSILEHILVQHLTAFYDVGQHGHMRLLSADWNDALDMAKEHGESVAFSSAYAGNLENLSTLLFWLHKNKAEKTTMIASEVWELMEVQDEMYDSVQGKQQILRQYCSSCGSYISGKKIELSFLKLAEDLHKKAEFIKKLIRKTEWIQPFEDKTMGWFNSYYDNYKNPVEGIVNGNVRMMLTGQVFTIMGKTATDHQISMMVKAVDTYLYQENVGGYRLNTDFKEVKSDLGRMFGFAYGTKENGSVFSHMAVMYSYALYSRNFVKEGYKVLKALYKQAANFEVSHMYPGIPEYFNQNGRGMYHYLTGAASWYMLTTLTQVFGVRGDMGNLQLEPKLMAEQFDEEGKASILSYFAERKILVVYENTHHLEIGDYEVEEVYIDQIKYESYQESNRIFRKDLEALDKDAEHSIRVKLS